MDRTEDDHAIGKTCRPPAFPTPGLLSEPSIVARFLDLRLPPGESNFGDMGIQIAQRAVVPQEFDL